MATGYPAAPATAAAVAAVAAAVIGGAAPGAAGTPLWCCMLLSMPSVTITGAAGGGCDGGGIEPGAPEAS
jgi:hypothetical protein